MKLLYSFKFGIGFIFYISMKKYLFDIFKYLILCLIIINVQYIVEYFQEKDIIGKRFQYDLIVFYNII